MRVMVEMAQGPMRVIFRSVLYHLFVVSLSSGAASGALTPVGKSSGGASDETARVDSTIEQRQGSLSLGPSCVTAMAYSAPDDLIYAVDGRSDELIIIDERMRLRIHVGPIGSPVVNGLIIDRTGEMYAVDGQGDQLLRVDRKTGKSKCIGPLGFSSVQSLACDRYNRVFGVDTETDQLVLVDTCTGKATVIARIGAPSIFSLAFLNGSVLYGADVASGLLYRIDVQTGACTPLSQMRERCCEVHGMTSCRDGRLLADAVRQDALCELNTTEGTVDRMIQIRSQSLSRFVTQAIPDALQTRVLFGLSLLSILLATLIRCTSMAATYLIEGWQQVRCAIADQHVPS